MGLRFKIFIGAAGVEDLTCRFSRVILLYNKLNKSTGKGLILIGGHCTTETERWNEICAI